MFHYILYGEYLLPVELQLHEVALAGEVLPHVIF
jgi:hypothetical protein